MPILQASAPAARAVSVTTPPAPSVPPSSASDDEILGIVSDPRASKRARNSPSTAPASAGGEPPSAPGTQGENVRAAADVPEELQSVFDANPALRDAWQAEREYRAIFPSVEDARAAHSRVAEFAQLDNWFFSGQPDAHAQLAESVYRMNPAAFRSLAQAIHQTLARLDGGRAAESRPGEDNGAGKPPGEESAQPSTGTPQNIAPQEAGRLAAFYQDTNAAIVEGVVDAIRGQVERLLPEGIAPGARNRVVGEIYRELDASLRSNRALADQVRQAFRSGAMDTAHQAAVVALILGRAKQALPGAAKKVINEWTTGVLASSNEKLARIRAAESRQDISSGAAPGFGGRRALSPRDVDYRKLSDADILNL